MAAAYDRVPPPYTQAQFNSLLADFEAWQNGFTPSGTFNNHFDFIITEDGTDTYCNNAYQTVYGGPSDAGAVDGGDPSAVIQAAWDNLASGGRIACVGDFDLGSTGLVFSQTKNSKILQLVGAGPDRTKFTFTGAADYAITVDTADGTLGDYPFRLDGFSVDCSSKTAGRHGILLEDVGRTGYVNNVLVENADIGFDLEGINAVYFYNCRANIANTGYKLGNTVAGSYTNEISFVNCSAKYTSTYGYSLESGATSNVNWFGGQVVPYSGTGIYLYGALYSNMYGVYFHDQSNAFDQHILITGLNANFPCKSIKIDGCYFKGGSVGDYAVRLTYGEEITLINPYMRLYNTANIHLDNNYPEIHVKNPYFEDVNLFDGNITSVRGRFAGTVETDHARGFIANTAVAVSAGDVLYASTNGVYTSNVPTQAKDNPGVAMFDAAINSPVVIATNGIVQVNCEAAVTSGDTLVVANGAGSYVLAEVDNYISNPKKIIGTSLETTGGAGLAYTLIGQGGGTRRTVTTGASTGTGAQQTIAHNLPAVPTQIRLWDKYGGDRADAGPSAASDATNIYITATAGKEYYWECVIDP